MKKEPVATGTRRHRDFKSALLLIVVGALVVWKGSDYPVGELRRMGPGYFPVALGIILAGLGALLLLAPALGSAEERAAEGASPVDLRGWGCIIGGMLAFIALGHYGGLIPATFALVFVSALGDRRNSLTTAALTAVVMTAVAVVVFSVLLGVQFPLFAWGR